MANRVFLNKEGFIEQTYEGKQTFETVLRAAARVMVVADKLHKNSKKVRVLVNIAEITNVSADALLAGADALNTIYKSKVALFGGQAFVNKLANLVIAAVGRQKTVAIFKNRKQAENWLKS